MFQYEILIFIIRQKYYVTQNCVFTALASIKLHEYNIPKGTTPKAQ